MTELKQRYTRAWLALQAMQSDENESTFRELERLLKVVDYAWVIVQIRLHNI